VQKRSCKLLITKLLRGFLFLLKHLLRKVEAMKKCHADFLDDKR